MLAIRQGVKTVVNKRLPGQKVRLTAAQKAGMKKLDFMLLLQMQSTSVYVHSKKVNA